MPNSTSDAKLRLKIDGTPLAMTPINNVQVAVKTNVGVVYFQTLVPLHVLLVEEGQLEQGAWLRLWKDEIKADKETKYQIEGLRGYSTVQSLKSKMWGNNVFTVAERVVEGAVCAL